MKFNMTEDESFLGSVRDNHTRSEDVTCWCRRVKHSDHQHAKLATRTLAHKTIGLESSCGCGSSSQPVLHVIALPLVSAYLADVASLDSEFFGQLGRFCASTSFRVVAVSLDFSSRVKNAIGLFVCLGPHACSKR